MLPSVDSLQTVDFYNSNCSSFPGIMLFSAFPFLFLEQQVTAVPTNTQSCCGAFGFGIAGLLEPSLFPAPELLGLFRIFCSKPNQNKTGECDQKGSQSRERNIPNRSRDRQATLTCKGSTEGYPRVGAELNKEKI